MVGETMLELHIDASDMATLCVVGSGNGPVIHKHDWVEHGWPTHVRLRIVE